MVDICIHILLVFVFRINVILLSKVEVMLRYLSCRVIIFQGSDSSGLTLHVQVYIIRALSGEFIGQFVSTPLEA